MVNESQLIIPLIVCSFYPSWWITNDGLRAKIFHQFPWRRFCVARKRNVFSMNLRHKYSKSRCELRGGMMEKHRQLFPFLILCFFLCHHENHSSNSNVNSSFTSAASVDGCLLLQGLSNCVFVPNTGLCLCQFVPNTGSFHVLSRYALVLIP